MSLFDVVNTTLATRIADAIGKYHTGFFTKRVLKTSEEVEANTNPKNLPSALVVGELINDLSGVSFHPESDGLYAEYVVGADAVRKKLGSGKKCATINLKFTMEFGGKDQSANGILIINYDADGNTTSVTGGMSGKLGTNSFSIVPTGFTTED